MKIVLIHITYSFLFFNGIFKPKYLLNNTILIYYPILKSSSP